MKQKKLMPFSPDYVITAKISTDYQVNPVKPLFDGKFDFDNWLSEIACHDNEVITLLWQIMNEAINPNHTRAKWQSCMERVTMVKELFKVYL